MFADDSTTLQHAAAGRLIDVRSEAEYAALHIEGALNLPLHHLAQHAERIAALPAPLVITCHSGQRAAEALAVLRGAGRAVDILLVEGGTSRWHRSGHPVRTGTPAMSIERQVRVAAGSMVLVGASLALAVSPLFAWLPLAIGAGLAIAGMTDSCLLGSVLARMPWNTGPSVDPTETLQRLEAACTPSA